MTKGSRSAGLSSEPAAVACIRLLWRPFSIKEPLNPSLLGCTAFRPATVQGWQWCEEKWHIDRSGQIIDACDPDGWSYGAPEAGMARRCMPGFCTTRGQLNTLPTSKRLATLCTSITHGVALKSLVSASCPARCLI